MAALTVEHLKVMAALTVEHANAFNLLIIKKERESVIYLLYDSPLCVNDFFSI